MAKRYLRFTTRSLTNITTPILVAVQMLLLTVERGLALCAVVDPIAIIIPCHRVIGYDGSLTGYAYGIERKRQLLLLEQRSPKE